MTVFSANQKHFVLDKKDDLYSVNLFLCQQKSFWKGTQQHSQIFWLAQIIWTGTKHFGTCKRPRQKCSVHQFFALHLVTLKDFHENNILKKDAKPPPSKSPPVFRPFYSPVIDYNWATTVYIWLEVIQQIYGPNFTQFWPPCGHFTWLQVTKLDLLPFPSPPLVHIVKVENTNIKGSLGFDSITFSFSENSNYGQESLLEV